MIKNALLNILLLSAAWDLRAAPTVFRVTQKKGPIFVKGPFELAWHPIRSRIIPMGTLIRVDPKASIEFAIQASAIHADEIRSKVKISQPLITRLDEDLIRRTEIGDYPLKGLWETGADTLKASKEFPMLSFASSFIRSMVTLERVPKVPGIDFKDEPIGVTAGAESEEIKILSPGPDALYFLSEGRATVPVIWETPKNDLTYRLYVWEDHDVRTRPLYTGAEAWYQVDLNKTGVYKVQIEDTTHRFRSPAIQITVDRPLKTLTSEEKHAEEPPGLAIALLSPYPRSTLTSDKGGTSQIFAWEDKEGLRDGEFYRLVIAAKGGVTQRFKTSALSRQIKLLPGHYTWFVQKLSSSKKRDGTASSTRALTLLPGPTPLTSLIKNAPSQTIYFDLR